MDWTAIFNALKPILAQGMRDGLRLVGMGLATHGFIQNGAGTEAFVGAGMTLAGLFWGWFTTSGYLQLGGLLKKLTAAKTQADAVKAAQILPPAAAVDTAAKSAAAQSVSNAIIAALLLGGLLISFAGDAHAQVKLKPLTGNIGNDLGLTSRPAPTSNDPLQNIIGALDAKLLPDLQYAKTMADASGSKVTAPCYGAWIDLINVRQKAVSGTDGTPLPFPDPGIISRFEQIVELRNALQPDSTFMIACSPVASMVKKDIVGFIGLVISGGAGLATLVPGL